MEVSIWATVLYVISTLALCVGFFLIKKCDKKIYAATWIPVTMIGLMGYQTMIAAIINFIGIPVNLVSVGISNLFLAVFVWYVLLKKKELQKYIFEKADMVIWCILITVVIIIAVIKYTIELLPDYNSVDAAVHFTMALDFVDNQSVNSMFFAALHNGLLIELFSPFVAFVNYFKIYVLGDVLYLLLAGLMFWGLIRSICKDNFLKFAGIFATVLYLLAYPLNSTLFGFSYMGLGVTVIGFIIIVADAYADKTIDRKLAVILLSFGCVSIFQAYVLFMPVVFFSLLAFVLVEQHKDNKLFSTSTVFTGLGIFLLPTFIGLWYTYGGIFGNGEGGQEGPTVGSAIAVEGGIYGDLFSNFIFLLPLVLFAWWRLFKNKKNNIMLFLLPMEIVFIAVLFAMALLNKVSAYYFYKNYYVLWLLFVFMAVTSLLYFEKQARTIVVTGALTLLFVVAAGFFQFDDFVSERNELLHDRVEAEAFGDIYMFNRSFLLIDKTTSDKINLYRYAYENLLATDVTGQVLISASWEEQHWFDAITNQRLTKYDAHQLADIINNKSVQYVVVQNDSLIPSEYGYILEALEKIYETSEGYIIKLY